MAAALVLDASIVLAWAMPDEDRDGRALDVLAAMGRGQAIVPGHWRAEVGNGALMALRRGRLALDDLAIILAQIDALEVETDPRGGASAWDEPLLLALATGLTLYDALYLELALRRGAGLATMDSALRSAARAKQVPLLPA